MRHVVSLLLLLTMLLPMPMAAQPVMALETGATRAPSDDTGDDAIVADGKGGVFFGIQRSKSATRETRAASDDKLYARVSSWCPEYPYDLWTMLYTENKKNGTDTIFATIESSMYLSRVQDACYTLMAADDVYYAWSSVDESNKVLLTAEDYYMSGVRVEAVVDDGEYESYPALDYYLGHDLIIQAMFSGDGEDPGAWVDVSRISWKYAREHYLGSAERLYDYLGWSDLDRRPYRVRAIQSGIDYEMKVSIETDITIRHDSPAFAALIATGGIIHVEHLAAGSYLVESVDGDKTTFASGAFDYSAYTKENGYQTDLSEVTEQLYGDGDEIFGGDWHYLSLGRYNSTEKLYTVDNMVGDVLMTHFGDASYDNERGRVRLRYDIDGGEGYDDVYHQAWPNGDTIEKYLPLPKRTEVKIYDLLPADVHFDREGDLFVMKHEDGSDNISVEATKIIANYKGTGRELVEFTIACPKGLVGEGYFDYGGSIRVSFEAYIEWADAWKYDVCPKEYSSHGTVLDIGPNIAAWIPSDGGAVLGSEDRVSMDDGVVVPCTGWWDDEMHPTSVSDFIGQDGMSLFGIDINGDGDMDTRSVLYSESTVHLNVDWAMQQIMQDRPYLYVSKVLEDVPEGTDVSGYEFAFQIKLYDDTSNMFVPAADRFYLIVEAACPDGTVPKVMGSGRTDGNGFVVLKAGQVIALQSDYKSQQFMVSEPEPGSGWYCSDNEVTGQIGNLGMAVTITNEWDSGYVFPKTGCTGTTPIYVIGGMMAVFGYAALAVIGRRKGKIAVSNYGR